LLAARDPASAATDHPRPTSVTITRATASIRWEDACMTDTAETRWESHNEAGRRLFSQGDYAAAEQEFVAAMREASSLGDDELRLASSLGSLAQIKYLQKDIEQAEALFKRALAIRERHLGEKHPDVAATLNSLARLYFRRNDFVAAAPLLMRLLAIKQESLGAHHPEVAVILTSLAKVRLAERQYEDAEQLARRALLIREDIHKPNDPAVAMSLDTLADVLAARGLLEEEQRLRQRIADIRGATAPARNRGSDGSDPPAAQPASIAAPTSPTPPARTTRSASLPWIEPPASPALRRPSLRPFANNSPDAVTARTPAAPKPPAPTARTTTPPAATRSTPRFVAQYTPPVTRPPERPAPKSRSEPVTGKVRGPIVHAGAERRETRREAHRQPYREPYTDSRPLERRRSPLKFAVAAVLLLGAAGGAWVYLSGSRITSSAGAALDPSPIDGAPDSRSGSSAEKSAPTAGRDPSYEARPPQRQKPPAAAYYDDPPVNVDRATDRARPANGVPVAAPADADSASPLAPTSAPIMPAVNVDRITSAIGDNAKAKADSLGRKTITVKPPDFDKPQKP
jgi:tetratricopeptide (TPR) repeat protein